MEKISFTNGVKFSVNEKTGYMVGWLRVGSRRPKLVTEHIYIADLMLNRRDRKGFLQIHHINCDKTDNHIENLCVMPASDHARWHKSFYDRLTPEQRPCQSVMKEMLISEYRGILLSDPHVREKANTLTSELKKEGVQQKRRPKRKAKKGAKKRRSEPKKILISRD